MLAIASQAIVIGFSVSVDAAAQRLAESEGIEIRTYDVIYRVIEDVQLALQGMLEPEYEEVVQGRAVVRQVFDISGVGLVAGCQVTDGLALRNADARVLRGSKTVHEGQVSSLKRYKENVTEVRAGMECGVGIEDAEDIKERDIIEFYTVEQVR